MAKTTQQTFISHLLHEELDNIAIQANLDGYNVKYTRLHPGNMNLEDSQNSPEKHLWIYCLLHAIKGAITKDIDDLLWLYSSDHTVGSFLWICDHIHISPSFIRKHIIINRDDILRLKLKHEHLVKIAGNHNLTKQIKQEIKQEAFNKGIINGTNSHNPK